MDKAQEGIMGADDVEIGINHIEIDELPILEEEPSGLNSMDLQYLKNRPIIITQLILVFLLILIKYANQFTSYKFQGAQMKILGCLLFSQSIVMHQRTPYQQIIDDHDIQTLIEAIIVGTLFLLGIFHFTRMNHFMPNSFKGQYQLIAQKVLDQNALDLGIDQSSDMVYENQLVRAGNFEDEQQEFLPPVEVSLLSKMFSICDFIVQLSVFAIMIINIANKEGKFDDPKSFILNIIKNLGLQKNLSLIAIFTISHINQSKYIGISKIDSFQFMMIRLLPMALLMLIVVRSDFIGNLKHHFEQLLFVCVYLSYFFAKDCSNSRRNQLEKYFDSEFNDSLNDSDSNPYKTQKAQNKEARMVLIMYRENGNGGIQGIVIDSYYMDANGTIANEFYLVDVDENDGEIKLIENTGLRKLHDAIVIQKTYYKYYLSPPKRIEVACNNQK